MDAGSPLVTHTHLKQRTENREARVRKNKFSGKCFTLFFYKEMSLPPMPPPIPGTEKHVPEFRKAHDIYDLFFKKNCVLIGERKIPIFLDCKCDFRSPPPWPPSLPAYSEGEGEGDPEGGGTRGGGGGGGELTLNFQPALGFSRQPHLC